MLQLTSLVVFCTLSFFPGAFSRLDHASLTSTANRKLMEYSADNGGRTSAHQQCQTCYYGTSTTKVARMNRSTQQTNEDSNPSVLMFAMQNRGRVEAKGVIMKAIANRRKLRVMVQKWRSLSHPSFHADYFKAHPHPPKNN